mgnify:CR=1 FL=1
MPKAEWFGERLKERVPSATVTPIEQKGKMFIKVDGEQVYSKGGFNATNPQPTPAEVAQFYSSDATYNPNRKSEALDAWVGRMLAGSQLAP